MARPSDYIINKVFGQEDINTRSARAREGTFQREEGYLDNRAINEQSKATAAIAPELAQLRGDKVQPVPRQELGAATRTRAGFERPVENLLPAAEREPFSVPAHGRKKEGKSLSLLKGIFDRDGDGKLFTGLRGKVRAYRDSRAQRRDEAGVIDKQVGRDGKFAAPMDDILPSPKIESFAQGGVVPVPAGQDPRQAAAVGAGDNVAGVVTNTGQPIEVQSGERISSVLAQQQDPSLASHIDEANARAAATPAPAYPAPLVHVEGTSPKQMVDDEMTHANRMAAQFPDSPQGNTGEPLFGPSGLPLEEEFALMEQSNQWTPWGDSDYNEALNRLGGARTSIAEDGLPHSGSLNPQTGELMKAIILPSGDQQTQARMGQSTFFMTHNEERNPTGIDDQTGQLRIPSRAYRETGTDKVFYIGEGKPVPEGFTDITTELDFVAQENEKSYGTPEATEIRRQHIIQEHQRRGTQPPPQYLQSFYNGGEVQGYAVGGVIQNIPQEQLTLVGQGQLPPPRASAAPNPIRDYVSANIASSGVPTVDPFSPVSLAGDKIRNAAIPFANAPAPVRPLPIAPAAGTPPNPIPQQPKTIGVPAYDANGQLEYDANGQAQYASPLAAPPAPPAPPLAPEVPREELAVAPESSIQDRLNLRTNPFGGMSEEESGSLTIADRATLINRANTASGNEGVVSPITGKVIDIHTPLREQAEILDDKEIGDMMRDERLKSEHMRMLAQNGVFHEDELRAFEAMKPSEQAQMLKEKRALAGVGEAKIANTIEFAARGGDPDIVGSTGPRGGASLRDQEKDFAVDESIRNKKIENSQAMLSMGAMSEEGRPAFEKQPIDVQTKQVEQATFKKKVDDVEQVKRELEDKTAEEQAILIGRYEEAVEIAADRVASIVTVDSPQLKSNAMLEAVGLVGLEDGARETYHKLGIATDPDEIRALLADIKAEYETSDKRDELMRAYADSLISGSELIAQRNGTAAMSKQIAEANNALAAARNTLSSATWAVKNQARLRDTDNLKARDEISEFVSSRFGTPRPTQAKPVQGQTSPDGSVQEARMESTATAAPAKPKKSKKDKKDALKKATDEEREELSTGTPTQIREKVLQKIKDAENAEKDAEKGGGEGDFTDAKKLKQSKVRKKPTQAAVVRATEKRDRAIDHLIRGAIQGEFHPSYGGGGPNIPNTFSATPRLNKKDEMIHELVRLKGIVPNLDVAKAAESQINREINKVQEEIEISEIDGNQNAARVFERQKKRLNALLKSVRGI